MIPINYFCTIKDFQNYFLVNDSLEIQPKEAFQIQDIRPLTQIKKSDAEVQEPKAENALKDVLRLLNKLVIPLGKAFSIFTNPSQDITYRIKNDFFVVFPEGATISVKKAAHIFARSSELFQLMISSSRLTLKLEPEQNITFIGLKESFTKGKSSFEDYLFPILNEAIVSGYKLSLNSANDLSLQCVRGLFESPTEEQGITLINDRGIEFSFAEDSIYNYTEDGFIQRMAANPLLNVPPKEKLIIRGDFSNLLIDYENEINNTITEYKDDFGRVRFVLDQLFLPFGKSIKLSPSKGFNSVSLSFEYRNDRIELSSERGFLFELIEGKKPLYIDLRALGERLHDHSLTDFTIQPNQEVVFYEIDPKEKVEIEKLLIDCKNLLKVLNNFFVRRLVIGFSWHIYTVGEIGNEINIKVKELSNHFYLCISNNKHPIHLSLCRPTNGATFALSIVQNCPNEKALRDALLERDTNGLLNLLFKSIYYCCCEFRYTHENLPQFFKEETLKEITKALEDKEFTEHLEKIMSNEDLYDKVKAIHEAQPEEFDQLDEEGLDESIVFIISKVKKIAYLELQNSQYLMHAIKGLLEFMEGPGL